MKDENDIGKTVVMIQPQFSLKSKVTQRPKKRPKK
jgi:hypothetical protein